jgi:hypothetical protein
MSKRTAGTLLMIGTPLLYITAILFKVVPFVTKWEMYGGCKPAKEDLLGMGQGEVCWDAIRTVIDPVGFGFAIIVAGLFAAGVILVGLHLFSRASH